MAGKPWTEQCKIDARAQIEKRKEEVGEAKKAMTELAGESGIPYYTLKRWYYKENDEDPRVMRDPRQTPENIAKRRAKVAVKIVKNIAKAIKKEEEEAQAYWQRKAAGELAEELGGAVLAEEMYELFLKIVKEMDEFVRANKEIGFPVSINWIKQQFARMARNSDVAEEDVEGVTSGELAKDVEFIKYCSNRTCENFVSKSDRKKARAAIKQKAKGNK
jgi:hypothetical protein